MRRLPRGLNVSGALVLAVDRLFGDERFEPGNRRRCDGEQLPRARFAELRDERRGLELHPGEHLTAVARTGAPPDLLALDHRDRRARLRQVSRRRQPREPGADDDDVRARGQLC